MFTYRKPVAMRLRLSGQPAAGASWWDLATDLFAARSYRGSCYLVEQGERPLDVVHGVVEVRRKAQVAGA
jgi:hypothetical protein